MNAFLKTKQFERKLAKENINHGDFARIMGISRQWISRLKSPDKYKEGASPELRERMLKFFRCDFDDLFFT